MTVDYNTFELDDSAHSATANKDFIPTTGTCSFKKTETEAEFIIKIIDRPEIENRD